MDGLMLPDVSQFSVIVKYFKMMSSAFLLHFTLLQNKADSLRQYWHFYHFASPTFSGSVNPQGNIQETYYES